MKGIIENTAPELAVIDYGMGNLRSVAKAFEHCGARVRILTEASQIGEPDALVLPGVGALGDCVAGLRAHGLDELVREWIVAGKPFFGICLGMQALFEHSEEGNVRGLGVFPGQVLRFRLPADYKIPHMGWNAVSFLQETPVNDNLAPEGVQFYFVHSYHCVPEDTALLWGETEYGGMRFVSAIRRQNCYATQFHPEKSQDRGLQMYRNFVQWVSETTVVT